MHAIIQARLANLSFTAISTDIPEVIDMTLEDDVGVFRRPQELASDIAEMSDVLYDLLQDSQFDDVTIVLLQATSPLRQANDILQALHVFENGEFDMVMSVCEAEKSVLKYGTIENGIYTPMRAVAHMFSNRQQLPEVFKPNGAIYIFDANWYRANKSLVTASIGTFVMSNENSIDIDTADDLERCENIIRSRMKADQK